MMPTDTCLCTGTSDRHCEEALPKTKPTAKKKRRREANWCAEAACELEEFGTQKTPGPTPAPAKQQKLSRTASCTERVKAALEHRKAQKTAGQLLGSSGPGTAGRAQAEPAAVRDSSDATRRTETLPTPGRPADTEEASSDSDRPSANAIQPEAGRDAWAEVLAEERAPQLAKTRQLPSVEAGREGEAACQGKQAETWQPEPALPPAKAISPSLMQRRSTRGIIDADALCSPPKGAPQRGRQPVQQQPDAACTISLHAAARASQRNVRAAASKAPAAMQTVAAGTAKAEQMRQASAAIKARRAKGEL